MRRVLKNDDVGGENQGYITGKGWNDYNYDDNGNVIYIENPFTGKKEKSEDRGLFRINNGTFYDIKRRNPSILKKYNIENYEDMYDVDKNIRMAKIILDEGGYCRWYAAPDDLARNCSWYERLRGSKLAKK